MPSPNNIITGPWVTPSPPPRLIHGRTRFWYVWNGYTLAVLLLLFAVGLAVGR